MILLGLRRKTWDFEPEPFLDMVIKTYNVGKCSKFIKFMMLHLLSIDNIYPVNTVKKKGKVSAEVLSALFGENIENSEFDLAAHEDEVAIVMDFFSDGKKIVPDDKEKGKKIEEKQHGVDDDLFIMYDYNDPLMKGMSHEDIDYINKEVNDIGYELDMNYDDNIGYYMENDRFISVKPEGGYSWCHLRAVLSICGTQVEDINIATVENIFLVNYMVVVVNKGGKIEELSTDLYCGERIRVIYDSSFGAFPNLYTLVIKPEDPRNRSRHKVGEDRRRNRNDVKKSGDEKKDVVKVFEVKKEQEQEIDNGLVDKSAVLDDVFGEN
jgi:hypothetical protein